MDKKDKQIVTKLTADLLEKIGFKEGGIEVEEEEGAIRVSIQTDNPGLLIGGHAQRLQALQLILRMMVAKKIGEWRPLLLDVNNYRGERKERLEQMAKEAAQRAVEEGREVVLPPMGAYDRRLIHLALADSSEVETESVGEEEGRRVVVKPKEGKEE